jgi:hypothetical protein
MVPSIKGESPRRAPGDPRGLFPSPYLRRLFGDGAPFVAGSAPRRAKMGE